MKIGIVVDYEIEGDFPKFGNDDDRVDTIARDITVNFMKKLQKQRPRLVSRAKNGILRNRFMNQ